jgi:hypothetical protein
MKVPIDSFEDPLTILNLKYAPTVYEMFDYSGRKALACHLVQAIVTKVAYITNADQVSRAVVLWIYLNWVLWL